MQPALKRGYVLIGVICSLLMTSSGQLNAEEGPFPGEIGFVSNTSRPEPEFLFVLESVMVGNGFQLDGRALPAEHSYRYSFRWTRPDSDKDFWKADNKWHGEGELTARLVPGGSASDMSWKITFIAKTYSFDVTRTDMEKVIEELLRTRLQIALANREGN